MSQDNFEKNVFINCPFDKDYLPLLRPLIFTIVQFGYIPRITLENSDSGTPRLEQLLTLIRESKYSIHDLSRLQSRTSEEYYRLNMPFELGLDYGSRNFSPELNTKCFLILETKKYEYMKAISDINGLDIKNHNDDPEKIIGCIREWFTESIGLRKLPNRLQIWYDFNDFNAYLFESYFNQYRTRNNEHTAEKMAKIQVEELSIPELIHEIHEFLSST